MHYTYVLESVRNPGVRYIGHSSDLRRRLHQHNAGENRATAQNRPWKVKLYIAFETRDLACEATDHPNGLESRRPGPAELPTGPAWAPWSRR